ncbi:RNA polymerase sigma factor SigA [Planctomycetes bacterium Pan216]|uniref:RNA polymerase sigma factor SigA n=1 Tax=Kolteria novifilia TaxID=2527975 RepID=A0A518B0S1_9BACT|nr:RNA polymerase sigma factor SigA [Planctomycetes bacterium Pan216]
MRSARSRESFPSQQLSIADDRMPSPYALNGGIAVLTPDEEAELVARIDVIRARIERTVAPVLRQAPEDVKLDHFDQIMTYFYRVRSTLKRSLVKKVETDLTEYTRIRDTLVLSNLPWVTKLARSQRQSAVSEEDLFQEGVCGLLKAIDRFEAARGLRLMTYATWYIREAMQQIRARQSHLVSLSAHDQTLLGRVEAERAAFTHHHERAPSNVELKERVPGKPRSLKQLLHVLNPTVSLDRGNMEGSIPIAIEDSVADYDHKDEVENTIGKLLESLPSRERFVVTRRFGLDGQKPTSLEALGDDLKVSKERVRQLQRQAIRRMQEHADEDVLELNIA